MRRRARQLFTSLTRGDGRYYAAGGLGFVVGSCLMTLAPVLTWGGSIRPGSLNSTYLIIGGQVVASASGFLASVPLMRRRQREERHRAGLCPSCGYDLRASPDRCPECGTVPPQS